VVVSVTPPEPAGHANGDRTAIFRTLANPLRRRILSYLLQHGEANSTTLARALEESTGTTSYHLRKLAEQKFVEEVPGKTDGRERWWRALPFHIQAPHPAKMVAAEWSAAIEHAKVRAEHDIDLYFRVLTEYEGPDGWAQSSRGGSYMTKQELLAFFDEYLALLRKYEHAAYDAPEGARPVALRFFAVPDDTPVPDDTALPDDTAGGLLTGTAGRAGSRAGLSDPAPTMCAWLVAWSSMTLPVCVRTAGRGVCCVPTARRSCSASCTGSSLRRTYAPSRRRCWPAALMTSYTP